MSEAERLSSPRAIKVGAVIRSSRSPGVDRPALGVAGRVEAIDPGAVALDDSRAARCAKQRRIRVRLPRS